ncbi:SDR family NAD(P)-dependent oxidoreductase [Streptomyces maremycinicus]|uniref:SDR family NAD(P)-dependent oxidoreductase n=1 Tax=Streptomyces maremycinicus TaxID=1679753 RepID=UPI0007885B16|nr:SDR family NAD(P)-dependent oxidoreductase [Streptomyces sp. NBRC 110468]
MSTSQMLIGSGFDETSTTADVLAGLDLTGRTALVTGGYSGVGLATTRALAGAGARVIVPARRPGSARAALAGLDDVEVDELDLADLDSVASFADRYLATGRSLDFVIGSAGIMAPPLERVGRGWESQFAVNHLGHFALVNRLWPALADGRGARVVAVSSRGHRFTGIRWEDPHFESEPYDKWVAYGQAKTANALFALHLDALGQGAGVRAFSVHPGVIDTNLQRHLPLEEQIAMGWTNEDGTPKDPDMYKSPEQGAATSVWAATSPRLADRGGVYLEDCDVAEIAGDPFNMATGGVARHAADEHEAARLWDLSARLTGVSAI